MNLEIEEFWQRLKTERDELRVKVHLGKAELEDEWEALEDKFSRAERKFNHLQHEAQESGAEIKQAFDVIGEEISTAYARIKSRLDG